MNKLPTGTLVQRQDEENRPLKWHARVRLAGVLTFVLAAAIFLTAGPRTVRAEGTQNGTFTLAASKRVTLYANLLSPTVLTPDPKQTVLVTVCVTTSGTQSVTLEDHAAGGALVGPIATLPFGQCLSVTLVLDSGHTLQLKAPTTPASTGTYSVSVQANPVP